MQRTWGWWDLIDPRDLAQVGQFRQRQMRITMTDNHRRFVIGYFADIADGFPDTPIAPLVDQNGKITAPWYRFFLEIQKLLGTSTVNPFDDTTLLSMNAAFRRL